MFISCTHGYTTNHDSNIMMILVIKHQGGVHETQLCTPKYESHPIVYPQTTPYYFQYPDPPS